VSAFGEQAAGIAGRFGDGLWTMGDPEIAGPVIDAYHAVFVAASWPNLETLAMLLAYTLVSLLVGTKIFDGYRDTFPELV